MPAGAVDVQAFLPVVVTAVPVAQLLLKTNSNFVPDHDIYSICWGMKFRRGWLSSIRQRAAPASVRVRAARQVRMLIGLLVPHDSAPEQGSISATALPAEHAAVATLRRWQMYRHAHRPSPDDRSQEAVLAPTGVPLFCLVAGGEDEIKSGYYHSCKFLGGCAPLSPYGDPLVRGVPPTDRRASILPYYIYVR